MSLQTTTTTRPVFLGMPERKSMSTSALHLASAPAPAPATGFRKILLTTDFSAASRAALPAALDLATLFGAKLSILHVFEYAESIPPLEPAKWSGHTGYSWMQETVSAH